MGRLFDLFLICLRHQPKNGISHAQYHTNECFIKYILGFLRKYSLQKNNGMHCRLFCTVYINNQLLRRLGYRGMEVACMSDAHLERILLILGTPVLGLFQYT
mmetsp:Transcript_30034/g.62492  ORF Transcript_30034/g.62492 Transcript_30034/m.62492 type:complete len:102 (+) Transcript_30034:1456-1761(+)